MTGNDRPAMRRRRQRSAATSPAQSEVRRPYALLAILGAALVVKFVALAQLHHHPLLQPHGAMDSAYYVELARQVRAGDLLAGREAFFVSPLYVYFLAATFLIPGSSLLVPKIVQVFLGTAAVALVYLTARRWFGGRAAWIAGVLAVATGLFTFYEVILLQAAIDPFLTALSLWLVSCAFSEKRWTLFAWTGLALGLLVLNRPNAVAYAAVLVPAAALADRSRRGAVHAAALALGITLAMAPVAARNYAVAGEFIPVASHGGLNFYIGNNPAADGTYTRVPGITPNIEGQALDARRVAEQATGRRLTEREVSAHFYREAFAWIGNQPAKAARLFARKLAYLLNATPLTLNYSFTYYRDDEATVLRMLLVGPWILIPLGLVGLLVARRSGAAPAYWAYVIFVPVYGLSVAAFFVSSRYRLPMLVPLVIGTAALLDELWERFAERRYHALAAPLLAALVLLTASNLDLGLDDARSEERTTMAVHLVGEGRIEEAERLAAMAVVEHPAPGIMHYRLGRAHQLQGRQHDAIRHFQEALSRDADQPEIRLGLGQALLDAGRAGDAVDHLRAAYVAGVRPDLAAFDLARALAATGRRAEAAAVLADARPGHETDASSWLALGELALGLGDHGLAERFLREAVRLAPEESSARERLGVALTLQGRSSEALGELLEAVRLDPGNASGHLNLAVVQAQEGRLREAEDSVDEALRLKPDYDLAERFKKRLRQLR
jgi:Flp pilus assembly protein TadD/4-amino-4-deoxy-L-arabinose transferase-like glycosyltransferase